MGDNEGRKTGLILDGFVESLFQMMLDHHRTHVVEMELTVAQAQALMLLRSGAATTTGLAASLGISAPAVTQLADRLVRKRLIERTPVDADRRSVAVALTAEGKRVVDAFRRRRQEVFAHALDRLDREDHPLVMNALTKLAGVLSSGEASRQVSSGKNAGESGLVSSDNEPATARTALDPARASKVVGEVPVGRPIKRMRIEWD